MEKDLDIHVTEQPKKRSIIKSALKEGLISTDLCTEKGLFWTSCLAGIGIVGSIASKLYQGCYSSFIHSYGHDVAVPFFVYWGIRGAGGGKLAASLAGFLGCTLLEFSQYLGLYPGTYDPNDFIAYASGTGLALTVDKLVFDKHKKKTLEEKIE